MTAREQRRSLECIQEGSKGAYYRVSVYGIDYINRLVRLKTETLTENNFNDTAYQKSSNHLMKSSFLRAMVWHLTQPLCYEKLPHW